MKTAILSAIIFALMTIAYALGKQSVHDNGTTLVDLYRADWHDCLEDRHKDEKRYANGLLMNYLNYRHKLERIK